MHFGLENRMKQTILERRKRHFNAEHQHTEKISRLRIFLFAMAGSASPAAGNTLLETIVTLLEDTECKERYE